MKFGLLEGMTPVGAYMEGLGSALITWVKLGLPEGMTPVGAYMEGLGSSSGLTSLLIAVPAGLLADGAYPEAPMWLDVVL